MAIRSDITVDWYEDPRIANVTTTSTELTVQDSHDTLTTIEDEPEGHQFEFLVSTAGKEDLGGGQQVGLTTTLNNVQYAPQSTSPRSLGTATATDITGITLTDTSADFVADGVTRGDWVINFTDQSVTEVLVVTATTLTTRGLRDGSANTFTTGDAYKVWEVAQFDLAGGNFVAVDDVGSNISPLFTVFGRFATRTSSSSATISEQVDIQFAGYNGGVSVDQVNGVSGTNFPTGTERQPVNNFIDALTIATERGFNTFYVTGDITIDSGQDFTDYVFIGQGQNLSNFNVTAAATVLNCAFIDATITGTLDGECHIEDCIITNLNYISGVIERCILDAGTITLGGGATAHFINCASGVPGQSTPIIDMGGSGQSLALRNYNGGIQLRNHSGGEAVSIDLNSGQIILEDTLTSGEIVCRGVGKLVDNSNGATVIDEMLSVNNIWSFMTNANLTTQQLLELLDVIHARLDLNAGKPNTYANDGSSISGADFTLTRISAGADRTIVKRT